MGTQVEGGLKLIFLNQVPRFRIGTCLGGGLELRSINWHATATTERMHEGFVRSRLADAGYAAWNAILAQ
jgi:hypothetical protein